MLSGPRPARARTPAAGAASASFAAHLPLAVSGQGAIHFVPVIPEARRRSSQGGLESASPGGGGFSLRRAAAGMKRFDRLRAEVPGEPGHPRLVPGTARRSLVLQETGQIKRRPQADLPRAASRRSGRIGRRCRGSAPRRSGPDRAVEGIEAVPWPLVEGKRPRP